MTIGGSGPNARTIYVIPAEAGIHDKHPQNGSRGPYRSTSMYTQIKWTTAVRTARTAGANALLVAVDPGLRRDDGEGGTSTGKPPVILGLNPRIHPSASTVLPSQSQLSTPPPNDSCQRK